jgi:hypothetical protein
MPYSPAPVVVTESNVMDLAREYVTLSERFVFRGGNMSASDVARMNAIHDAFEAIPDPYAESGT